MENYNEMSLREDSSPVHKKPRTEVKKPAWHDEDDDIPDSEGLKVRHENWTSKLNGSYRERLVESFQLVHGKQSWADSKTKKSTDIDLEKDDESDDDNNEKVPEKDRKNRLLPGSIKIIRLTNLNDKDHEEEYIKSIEFHPETATALVAGSKGKVNMFQVDGVSNDKIHSAYFEGFNLQNMTLSTDGLEFYTCSPSKQYFFTYDLYSGKIQRTTPTFTNRHERIRRIVKSPTNKILLALGHHGNIYVHAKESKELIETLKINGEVQDLCFNESGNRMFASGTEGDIYEYDMDQRSCIGRWKDDSSVCGSTIAMAPNFLASGSSSGVVNIYDPYDLKNSQEPKPIKSLMNLTKRVTSLVPNSTGQLLAYASYEKRDVVKLVHFPSMTVYSDFPYRGSHFGRPCSMAISPNSGFFSIGNDKGEALLFRIQEFENY